MYTEMWEIKLFKRGNNRYWREDLEEDLKEDYNSKDDFSGHAQ